MPVVNQGFCRWLSPILSSRKKGNRIISNARKRIPFLETLEERAVFDVAAALVGTQLNIKVNPDQSKATAYLREASQGFGFQIQVADNSDFLSAVEFSPSSVSSVQVVGTSGSEKLILTLGTIDATLETTGLTSVDFQSGANFTQKVTIEQASGLLQIRNVTSTGDKISISAQGDLKVEGMVSAFNGVELSSTSGDLKIAETAQVIAGEQISIHAGQSIRLGGTIRSSTGGIWVGSPVTLEGGNVQVDGGAGDVTFTSEVDGLNKGEQSLVVISSGNTTFRKSMGEQVPLKSFQTLVSAPLQTEAGKTQMIPLHYLPVTKPDGSVEVKYGIEVAIGIGNASRMYEFDTGGTGFWAGYDPAVWQGVVPSGLNVSNNYDSGIQFDGKTATALVTLGTGPDSLTTAQGVDLVGILHGTDTKTGQDFQFNNPNQPPIEGQFFGDFGASLGLRTDPTITSVLNQFSGSFGKGYIVQLGPVGTTPQLQVGLTDDLRKQFPYTIYLDEEDKQQNLKYPVSGYKARKEFAFKGNYSLTSGKETKQIGPDEGLNTLFDTGAPSATFHVNKEYRYFSSNGKTIDPGTVFTISIPEKKGTTGLKFYFTVGKDGSINQVGYSDKSSKKDINTGLNIYNYFDVMFDLEKGQIGLRPNGGFANLYLNSVKTTGEQKYGQNAFVGGSYETDGGNITVSGAVTLGADTILKTDEGDVTFLGPVNGFEEGSQSLLINSKGVTTFLQGIGLTAELKDLKTDEGGVTYLENGAVTKKSQEYGDEVHAQGEFKAKDHFTAKDLFFLEGMVSVTTTNGDISFKKSVDGAQQLFLSGGKSIEFKEDIGKITPLAGLAISAATRVQFDKSVNLDGTGPQAASDGLILDAGLTNVNFASQESRIRGFSGNGLVLGGDNTNSLIQGFLIENCGNLGIALIQGDYKESEFRNNTVKNNGAGGMALTLSEKKKADFTPSAHSILKGLNVSSNEFLDNQGPGIQFDLGNYSDILVKDNLISKNEWGIQFESGTYINFLAKSNKIKDNQNGGVNFAQNAGGQDLEGNLISGNEGDGVLISGGRIDPITFSSNQVEANQGSGLQFLPGTYGGSTFENNIFTANTQFGALFDSGSFDGITLESNAFQANSQAGVFATGGDLLHIQAKNNTFSANIGPGLILGGGVKGLLLDGNNFFSNLGSGIILQAGDNTGTTIRNSKILANTGSGVEFAGGVKGLTFSDNTIGDMREANPLEGISHGPNNDGIVLSTGVYDQTRIRSNAIQFNRSNGIYASGGVQSLVIEGNTFEGNGRNGIEAANGEFTGTVITANRMVSNGVDGVSIGAGTTQFTLGDIDNAKGNTISGNMGSGVRINGLDSHGNRSLSNGIFGNFVSGITLTNGANNGIVAPVLNSAQKNGGAIQVQGTLAGAVNTVYLVQLFANTANNRSIQGENPLKIIEVTTDQQGKAIFTIDTKPDSLLGFTYTATATDKESLDTSAFSNGVVLSGSAIYAVGTGSGIANSVSIYNAVNNQLLKSFSPYFLGFRGGVTVATADLTGDGIPEIITGPGPGGGPNVRVFDGTTGKLLPGFLGSFMAFQPAFTGGVNVAVGDVNGDGRPDIICGAGVGGGPNVKVFSGVNGGLLKSFYAFDPNFRGGVNVFAGHFDGDTKADIICGAGLGGGPIVRIYSGANLSLIRQVLAFQSTFTGGVFVAAIDLEGTGRSNLIVGAGRTGGSELAIYRGDSGKIRDAVYAYSPSFTGGVRIAIAPKSTGAGYNILTASGPGLTATVRLFDPLKLQLLDSLFAFSPNFRGGAFV